jgi:cytoskeletal protein CcmA (bactofilin family)
LKSFHGMNILSKNIQIHGTVRFIDELVIEGKIEGEIISDGALTVGENADIRGEIRTRSVTVLGKVHGSISVRERCELKAPAHLVGDLKAGRLVIEEGATFVGESEVPMNRKALPIESAHVENGRALTKENVPTKVEVTSAKT